MRRFIRALSSLLVSVFMTTVLISFPLLADPTDIDCLSVSPDHDFSASTNIVSTWSSHVNVEFTFTNTGSNKIENWYIIFSTPYTIENIWNGSIVDTDEEGAYTICGANWNRDIEVGSSVTVGLTLASEDGSDITDLPNRFILNTTRETVSPENYSITYVEYSRWDDGFNGVLTIRANETVEDWELTAVANEGITQASGAVLTSGDNGQITFSNDGSNQDIEKDNPYSIFIQGVNTTGNLQLTDIVITTNRKAFTLAEDSNDNGIPDYLEAVGITPTPEPTVTPEPTATTVPTNTTVPTVTSEPTVTATPTVTQEPTATPTVQILPTDTPTATPTDIPVPTVTATPTPTVSEDDLLVDSDGDGLYDIIEQYLGYNPNNPDSNANGIPDGDEDFDNDGLTNLEELSYETFIDGEDSDNDKIPDGEEVHIYQSNPLNCDSDEDTVDDGEEIWIGKDPNDPSDGQTLVTQTVSGIINNQNDQFITSVDITMAVNDYLDYDVYSEDLYGIDSYSTGVYGRRGSPIGLNSYVDFDSATITLHYNEAYLNGTNEEDLGLLWYDEENGIYIEQEQAVVDTANNTITAELTHFSTYVPVDLSEWNEPIIPNNTDYVKVASYGTTYISWPEQEPGILEEERDCFAWWSLSERYDYKKIETISAAKWFEPTGRVMEHWHYEYEWLVIAQNDEDDDGVPDILERNGVMGLNGRVYRSSTDSYDTDGDGISDADEYGTIYTLYRVSEDNFYLFINGAYFGDRSVVYDELEGYEVQVVGRLIRMTAIGESNSLAILNSDPNSEDTDGDGVPDNEDGAPFRENRMINYLVVGQDNDGEKQVRVCADCYEELLCREHMRYYRIDVFSGRFFIDGFWSVMDRYTDNEILPRGAIYTSVDNCIIVSHGSESAIHFNGTDGIACYEGGVNHMSELKSKQPIHINVVDIQACNCANITTTNNISLQLMVYCDITEVYGWDTDSYYDDSRGLNYYYFDEGVGYIVYYRDGDLIQATPLVGFLLPPFESLKNLGKAFVYPTIHSKRSGGDY